MNKFLMSSLFAFMFIVNVIPSYALKFYPLNYDKRIDIDGGYGEFTLVRGPVRKTRNNNAKDFPDHL